MSDNNPTDPSEHEGFEFLHQRMVAAAASVAGADPSTWRKDNDSVTYQLTKQLWQQLPWQVCRALNVVARQLDW